MKVGCSIQLLACKSQITRKMLKSLILSLKARACLQRAPTVEAAKDYKMPDARAEQPLRFWCNPLLSCIQYVSDHRAVTFLHRCSKKQRYSCVSRQWQTHMVPYAAHPGRDVGMTEDDYAWLLHECRANADWQLNVCVSFAARLLKSARLNFEYRGQPTYAASLGWPPYLCDGRSVGG